MPKKKTIHRRTHTHNGKTIDRTFTTKALADEWKAAMSKRSARVRAGLPLASEDVLFKVAAAKWILLRQKTSDYWKFEEAKFRRVFVPALGDRIVRSITKGDIEAVLHTARLDLRLTGATFNRYRIALHTFYEHLIDEGACEHNPVTKIEIMKEVRRGTFVSDDMIKSYLEEARKQSALYFVPFVVLAMNAGPRTGELLGFRWSDFRPELNRMEITRRYQVHLNRDKDGTKGGGGRFIPLNEFAIAVLERYRSATQFNKPDDFIFHRTDGTRASASMITKIHRRVAKLAGIPDSVRLYDITRHKFASEITKHLGLRTAQILLGHASAQTTERYAHHDADHLMNKAITVKVGDDEKE